jgi:hypothetical protein
LVRTSTAEKLVFSAVKIGYVRSSELNLTYTDLFLKKSRKFLAHR